MGNEAEPWRDRNAVDIDNLEIWDLEMAVQNVVSGCRPLGSPCGMCNFNFLKDCSRGAQSGRRCNYHELVDISFND